MNINGLSKRLLLIILDGYGISDNTEKNAILAAKKPNLDKLFQNYPYTELQAGGEIVGLPKGVAGNSEVGHLNLGSGRPVRQDLVRINEAIEKDTLASMDKLQELISETKKKSGRVHLVGLLSDGGVHSHINHLKEFFKILSGAGLQVYFHAFMDGRDTPKTNGVKYLQEVLAMDEVTLASVQGRSIGMDRDRRWEKIQHAYDTFLGKGNIIDLDPVEYLKAEYDKDIYDEFITPALFNSDYAMKEEDSIFFCNFRPDRAIQLSLAFNEPNFNEFKRDFIPHYYLCLTPYIPDEVDLPVLFDREPVRGGISEYLSKKGLKQFKIAETEKYAHVTFFFNGGGKDPFEGEERVLVPSPKEVATYDEKPEMSAYEVSDKLEEALKNKDYTFYLVNFANADMVGHTGNYEAAIKAIEALDEIVGRLMKTCSEEDISFLLTADHGNSDQMVYPDGLNHTSHTGSPVPLSLFHSKLEGKKVKVLDGPLGLKDVAPSALYLMGLPQPEDFQGHPIFLNVGDE